jgi:hypothetical protein
MRTPDPAIPANSPLGRAQQALTQAKREVYRAADEAEEQPRLDTALRETAEDIEEHQAAIESAEEADRDDAEERGAAGAEREEWKPPPPI